MALSQDMHAGALQHVISIEQPPTADDGMGGQEGDWTDFLSEEFAAVRPLGGAEQSRSDQTEFRHTHLVTMNYVPDFKPTTAMRVKFEGRYLYIVAVQNPDERNEWLELRCEERAA